MLKLTCANALLWALGNGLVSTTLVVYLGLSLGASGFAIAWLLAAPRFAGVLRLGGPSLIAGAANHGIRRKRFCLVGYASSCVVLSLVPVVARSEIKNGSAAIGLLALAWCVYHLLEYLATIALWSWIGDLYPRRLRSQLLGVRERWLTTGRLVGVGASVALAFVWNQAIPDAPHWAPLAASAAIGTLFMLLALVPLAMTPGMADQPSAAPAAPWQTIGQALIEKPYRRLLVYNCWLGFANGLTASAMAMYPWRVLGIGYATMQCFRATMWGGQAAIAPWCGRVIARTGARRLMLPMQLIVATGPAWYLVASPEQPWWIAAAFVAWIAYAGLNVGLDSLKLDLAPRDNNAPYLAVYHTLSDFSNGVTMLLGGFLYDTLTAGDQRSLRVYAGLFLVGWILRAAAAGLILCLVEPKATPGDDTPDR